MLSLEERPAIVAPEVEFSVCPRVGEFVGVVETVKAHGTSVWCVDKVMHRAGGGTNLVVVPS